MFDIIVKRVNQGWIVTVGCQTLVFTDKDTICKAFKDYIMNPKEAEAKWLDEAGKRIAAQGLAAPAGMPNSAYIGMDCGAAMTERRR